MLTESVWTKSSRSSSGNCVEAMWTKSSHSAQGDCVEAVLTPDIIYIRDSKDPDGPVLTFHPDSWTTFTDAVKDGQFG